MRDRCSFYGLITQQLTHLAHFPKYQKLSNHDNRFSTLNLMVGQLSMVQNEATKH